MKERLTTRRGKFVYINPDAVSRDKCKREYGFHFCHLSSTCPQIANRQCPFIQVLDRLAEYEDKAERDAVEVRHGEWIPQKLYKNDPVWFCSECRTVGSPQWKRCPVCEAKMYGERKDQDNG